MSQASPPTVSGPTSPALSDGHDAPPAAISPPPVDPLLGWQPPEPPPPAEIASLQSLAVDETHGRLRREATFWLFTAVPSALVSIAMHLALLIGLGVCVLATHYGAQAISLVVVATPDHADMELQETPIVELDVAPDAADAIQDGGLWAAPDLDAANLPTPVELLTGLDPAVVLPGGGSGGGAQGLFTGTHSERGRVSEDLASRAARRQQALAYGATLDSENAVEMALQWLVKHQRQDGSWCFDHRQGSHHCVGCLCGNQGGYDNALNAATALGVLPLLGAGHTHLRGRYRQEVARGLAFLIYRQKPNGSLMEPNGNMYSHGLATLALCEALAMTQQEYPTALTEPPSGQEPGEAADEAPVIALDELRNAAQAAIDFIEYAQHSGGGWRYQSRQPGDTSVVGWQMMSLKSGYLAGLDVQPEVVDNARKFLDRVSQDQVGSGYDYMAQNKKKPRVTRISINRAGACTPIGLLCRMYTGWERDREGMRHGAHRIGRWARPNQGLYFYYYAAQVMHHYGGPVWESWDNWMRDHLVNTQSREGSEKGSWNLSGPHDSGRLYCTSLAAMTLEVYYRYSPIYAAKAVAPETTPPENAAPHEGPLSDLPPYLVPSLLEE